MPMVAEWVAAVGEWAGAIAAVWAVIASLKLAKRSEERAEKAERESMEMRDRYEREAVSPRWLWDPLSSPTNGPHVARRIHSAVYNLGRGPAYDIEIAVVGTDTGLIPGRVIRQPSLPNSPTGQYQLIADPTPWRISIEFDFPAPGAKKQFSSGAIRLTWRDSLGNKGMEERRFTEKPDQSLSWAD